MPITRQQARAVDQDAVERLGVPSILLMENASINAAGALIDMLDIEKDLAPGDATVVVLCGGGNNGGDGYAMARHLHLWGVTVTVVSVKPIAELDGDAAVMARIVQAMGLDVVTLDAVDLDAFDAVVDALLGTGFTGESVREPVAGAIRAANTATQPLKLAVDTPSGLDVDTGVAAEPTFKAELTVTFVDSKTGFSQPGAADWTGRVVVADIGVPTPE